MIVSAVEPISDDVRRHPQYVHGLDLDWESILAATDRQGLRLVVQNVPACILGRYAHRSLFLRMRVARILAGLPRKRELREFVERTEGLSRRLSPEGLCADCRLLSVCHRYFAYPIRRRVAHLDARTVVRRCCGGGRALRRRAGRLPSSFDRRLNGSGRATYPVASHRGSITSSSGNCRKSVSRV